MVGVQRRECNPVTRPIQEVKKLRFSSTELRHIADQTKCFRSQAGERRPLEGGLNAVQLLGLFNLSNAVSYLFADRFIRLFWLHRAQERGVEIGFEEFVKVLSVWTRVLFHLYDRGSKGYVVKEDIVEILQSLFLCFFKSGVAPFDWNSEEFRAKVILERHAEEEISKAAYSILEEWAEAAIQQYHTSGDDKLLWYQEFLQWIVHMPGVAEALCVPTDVRTWLYNEDQLPQ